MTHQGHYYPQSLSISQSISVWSQIVVRHLGQPTHNHYGNAWWCLNAWCFNEDWRYFGRWSTIRGTWHLLSLLSWVDLDVSCGLAWIWARRTKVGCEPQPSLLLRNAAYAWRQPTRKTDSVWFVSDILGHVLPIRWKRGPPLLMGWAHCLWDANPVPGLHWFCTPNIAEKVLLLFSRSMVYIPPGLLSIVA